MQMEAPPESIGRTAGLPTPMDPPPSIEQVYALEKRATTPPQPEPSDKRVRTTEPVVLEAAPRESPVHPQNNVEPSDDLSVSEPEREARIDAPPPPPAPSAPGPPDPAPRPPDPTPRPPDPAPSRLARVPLLQGPPYSIVDEMNTMKADITVAQLIALSPNQHQEITKSLRKERARHVEDVLVVATTASQSPRIPVIVAEEKVDAIVDGGSTTSVISADFAKRQGLKVTKDQQVFIRLADGTTSEPLGRVQEVSLQIGKIKSCFDAVVLPKVDYEVLLGIPVLQQLRAKTDWSTTSFLFDWYGTVEEVKAITSRPLPTAAAPLFPAESAEDLETDSDLTDDGSTISFDDVRRLQLEPKTGWEALDISHLETADQSRLREILATTIEKNSPDPQKLGRTTKTRHRIQLTSEEVLKAAPARTTPNEDRIIDESVRQMLAQGVIRQVQSPYTSRVVLVPKKDGTLRFCVDYRRLNRITVKDNMPLPRIADVLDSVGNASWFTSLDLQSGYWQIPMDPEDILKTGFVTKRGTYAFEVMPFGLTNAPATFQRLMNELLYDLLGTNVIAYLDDITIYSRTKDDHLRDISCVLSRLVEAGLTLNLAKCQVARPTIELLGYQVGVGGVGVLPKRAEAIDRLRPPRNATEVRQFLGICAHYRHFVAGFSQMAHPLHELLRKNYPFVWQEPQQCAFEAVKTALCTAPLLKPPDFSRPFVLATDASDYAVGAVLQQADEEGKIHPVCYYSRKMSDAELKYPTLEKECLAIIRALEQFRHYLLRQPVRVQTDHRALIYIMNGDPPSKGRLARWYTLIREFDLEIAHIKGTANAVADGLSRLGMEELRMIETPERYELVATVLRGEFVGPLTAPLMKLCRKFRMKNDRLYRWTDGSLIPVEPDPHRRSLVINAAHELGHYGIRTTFERVRPCIWWPTLYRECQTHVVSCHVCQLHQVIPAEPRPWKNISADAPFERLVVDFLGPLPPTIAGNKYVIVAIDCYSRWPWAKAVPEATALVAAQFLVEIIHVTAVPRILQSDQGSHFVNHMIDRLCQQVGMSHLTSSPYRPQTNGKVERFNRTLLDTLGKEMARQKRDWDGYLSHALFAYRTKPHRTTGKSPYEVLYGFTPRLPFGPEGRSRVLRTPLSAREVVPEIVSRFKVGDEVLVQKGNPAHKLDPPNEGPYRVIIANPLNLVLKDPTGRLRPRVAHMDQCQLYHRRVADDSEEGRM